MSQHYFTTNEGRKVLYGLDKATGGFFFIEFWKDEEIVDDEVKESLDGLTLTDLNAALFMRYGGAILDTKTLVQDWTKDQDPSPMQYQVNKMFGKDLTAMLSKVQADLFHNFSY